MATGEELTRNPQMQLGGLLGEWPTDGPMQFVDEVVAVRHDAGRVVFTCRTNKGEECEVWLAPCGEHVLRLTLVPAGVDGAGDGYDLPTRMLVSDSWPEVPVELTESADFVSVAFGGLRVRVRRRPWEFELLDSSGKSLVREHRSDTNLRGWRRTTWLGYARGADGRVSRTFEAFQLGHIEHLFGLGERFVSLDRRGKQVDMWNWNTWGATSGRAYKNVPFYMSTNGYGCFVHTTRRILWDFGSGQDTAISTSIDTEDPRLDMFLIQGPEFPKIIERYTELTGRAVVPPKWSFGFWQSFYGYRSWDEVNEVADGLRERGLSADVIHLDPYWMREGLYADLIWDEKRFPEPAKNLAALREKGFRICLWIQPWIPSGSENYTEGAAGGYFAKTPTGAVYHYVPTIPGNPPAECGIVDFTNPETTRWYKDKLIGLIRQGVAAFKTDFGEAISEDAVFANGMTGREVHNIYPILYNDCVYEAFREAGAEPFVWGRSGWAGIQRYPISWSGDQRSNYPSMACTIWGGLSFGLSGVPFWSNDIGGFEGVPDSELYIRWLQWGLLCSHARSHGTTRREPWLFGPDAVRNFREYNKLRYRLIPYLLSCAREAVANGMPVMRALVLADQNDPNAWAADTEYLLGPDLLVCPVLSSGATSQRVYLPRGEWTSFWTNERFDGGRWVDAPVTLDQMPLFVRAGSVLPMGPDEQWVGEHPDGEMTLVVYPDSGGSAAGSLRHDTGTLGFEYSDGQVVLSGARPTYSLAARLAGGGPLTTRG